jgi:hypothetical protein
MKKRENMRYFFFASGFFASGFGAPGFCGSAIFTGAPGPIFITPSTITLSPGLTPP